VLVVVNLDPFNARKATVSVPLQEIGASSRGSFRVLDLLTDASYTWTDRNYVHLDPIGGEPAHLFRVEAE
jgi:starch synthase (maltosyl-transferring)